MFRNNFLLSKDEKKLILYFGSEANVTIPDGVTAIQPGAFSSRQLTDVTIPASVTIIGDSAFRDNQLTSIIIPDSVTTIGDRAFAENQITNITIGANVELGNSAFDNNFGSQYRSYNDWYGRNINNRIAGTYARQGNSWVRR